MSVLGRPAVAAALFAAAAVAIHPALGAASWLPGRDLVAAALLLLAAATLVARALAAAGPPRVPAWLAAAGATAVVAALGADGIAGHHGTLTLGAGQARGHFDEVGPGGRSLGLRPMGFNVGVEQVRRDGGVDLSFAGGRRAELRGERAVSHGGYRFARPRVAPTGGAARLRVAVSDGTRTAQADLVPGAPPAQAASLQLEVEQYFPDFALDERQQPFTRSLEARNPAAVLRVRRGAEAHRAFVMQSMPGVHRVEALGVSFSLVDVEPEKSVEMAVHREPAALVALAGGLLLALSVGLAGLRAWRSGAAVPPADLPLVAGAALVLALLLMGRGSVVAWRLAVPSRAGALELAGVGVFLGAGLLAALLGTLLLAAQHAAGTEASVRPAGRGALWASVAASVAGLVVGGVQVAAASDVTSATALPLAGVALAAVLLAAALWATRGGRAAGRAAHLVLPLAVAGTLAAAALAGARSLGAEGTYATPLATAAASTALFGLASLESTALVALRRLAFLAALFFLLVAPS